MKRIEIDDEVFEFLQKNAVPLLDTPNTVLRKLLLGQDVQLHSNLKIDDSKKERLKKHPRFISENLISNILKTEFNEDFHILKPNQYMFESDSYLIYFQNYNKEKENLWFRIQEKPLNLLKQCTKKAFICLTYPPDYSFYLIPTKDIQNQIC